MKFDKQGLQKRVCLNKFHNCKHHYLHIFYHQSVHFTEISHYKSRRKKLYPAECRQGANLGNTKKKCNISSGGFLRVLISIRNDIIQIYNIKHRVSFMKLLQVTLWQKQKCKHFFLMIGY